jgi:hypothetical protein
MEMSLFNAGELLWYLYQCLAVAVFSVKVSSMALTMDDQTIASLLFSLHTKITLNQRETLSLISPSEFISRLSSLSKSALKELIKTVDPIYQIIPILAFYQSNGSTGSSKWNTRWL